MGSPRLRGVVVAVLTLAALLVGSLSLGSPTQAQTVRDQSAEAWVSDHANRGLQILDGKGAAGVKTAAFSAFIDQVADVPKVTNFVLGKHARSLSAADHAQFATLFREYAIGVYQTRLGYLSTGQVTVTGSLVRKPGDVIVSSTVSGGQVKSPLQLLWRVNRNAAGDWRVVDVQVSGVWLAITQQQDFVATIDNAGGKLGPLLEDLRRQVSEFSRAGK